MTPWEAAAKRSVDFIVAAVATVLLAPVGLLVAAILVIDSPGGVVARLPRLGRGGRPFHMVTFRTDLAGNAGSAAPTPAGRVLIRTGLYKLPAFLNVLAGHMSLVGPGPMDAQEAAELPADQRALLFMMRPGLINPGARARIEAQDHARSGDAVGDRDMRQAAAAIEVAYVREFSLARDASILWTRLLALLQPTARQRRGRRYTLRERLAAVRPMTMLMDALLAALIAVVAVGLRIDRTNILAAAAEYWILIPFAAVIRPAGFALSGVYLRIWRYPTVGDAMLVVTSLALGSLVMALGIFIVLKPWDFPGTVGFPRSAILIEFALSVLVLGGMRLIARVRMEEASGPAASMSAATPRTVLISGAGDAGALLVREMQRNPTVRLEPVGFVDDRPEKAGLRIYGLPVLGTTDDIPRLASEHAIAEVIVAQPGIAGSELRRIVALCSAAGVSVRTLPGMQELLDDTVTVNRIRAVRVEDLLRREPQDIPETPIRQLLAGRTILVTGAGGSIGSEACRQIAALGAAKIILLERGETPLFFVDEELRRRFPSITVVPILGDITREAEVERVFADHAPSIVLHAAAHKHVPLSEQNVAPAVLTNVRGTRNVAESAARHGVDAFIFISTDKAVDPSSVMGATKRIGEAIVGRIGESAQGRFVVVRFGNVMGSQGSVLELFRQQIMDGGPVTVTHPDMTRYFMTIPEAVRLILLAGAIGERGAIHVLNMGQPIRILDLARELIRLSVPSGEKDIGISFTGLRPGEKLEEELFGADEERLTTEYPFLLMARSCNPLAEAVIFTSVDELEAVAESGDAAATRRALSGVLAPARP